LRDNRLAGWIEGLERKWESPEKQEEIPTLALSPQGRGEGIKTNNHRLQSSENAMASY
jgi:hypothetical protein